MNIAVYCGASKGNKEKFEVLAKELGKWIGKNNCNLVYGGGKVGLMGIIADSVMENNGNVVGVIPKFLFTEQLAHKKITQIIKVENMSQRKNKMANLADVYIALPGGAGTLEEITEVISWSKMKLHNKPCILFDIDGFYQPLRNMYEKMIENGFMEKDDVSHIYFINTIDQLDNIINKKTVS